ncbi:MAG: hypothetical protein ACLP6E_17900 [Acidimicrobiales bacterium]
MSEGGGDNWDPEGLAVAALGEVVDAFGAAALADAASLANRLSDLIPNDTLLREQRLLVAASRRNVAATIEEHMSQGIGIGAAVRLTAAALYEQEPFDSSGCEWVAEAFAGVLGYRTESISVSQTQMESPSATYAPPESPPVQEGRRPTWSADEASPPTSATPRIYPSAPATAAPSSPGSRTKIFLASSIVVVLAVTGITIGVLASSSAKGPSKKASTSTSVRTTHTSSGPTSSSSLPAGPPVWSSPQDVDPGSRADGGIAGVSCSAPASCVAVDNDGNAFSYLNGSWSALNDVDEGTAFDAVSCATSVFCVAVDDAGDAFTYEDGTWGQPTDMDGSNTLAGISCPTASFCVAVDDNGNAMIYDDGTWGQPTDIDAGNDLDAVSCASPTSCTAVDDDGNVITYDGSNWGQPDDVDGGATITSISCPSSSFCMAVDENGSAIGFEGGTWIQPGDIDASRNLDGVSCPTLQFCMAADQDGVAVTARSA